MKERRRNKSAGVGWGIGVLKSVFASKMRNIVAM
jgi:hypothetical protein